MFVSSEQMLEQQAERQYRKEMTEKIKRLFGKKSPKPGFKTVLNQKFELEHKLLKDVDTSFELVKKIYDNGGATFEHITGSGILVCLEEPREEVKEKAEKRGLKIMLLEELLEVLK